ncbi:MAG: hypothetical protein ACE5H1_04155 [Thermodesulfobacteriota bacterium]
METEILDRLGRIETLLALGSEPFAFYADALEAYRKRVLKGQSEESQRHVIDKLRERFALDKELRFPHRKILDSLLSHYDFKKGAFQEIHFSALVEKARIGKSVANRYLSFLESRGYIQRRTDGYRVYFKIAEERFNEEKGKSI